MAKKVHHTKTVETKPVYHTHTDCSEYLKIKDDDRVTREQCAVCAAMKKG